MGTSKYLDSVLRIMPAVQARQLSELLQDLQATGAVRNADEYKEKLRELSTAINDRVPKPSFQQIGAFVWNLCSSESHNTMMKAFKNDLEAAFLQVDEVGTKVNDHNELLMKNIIADLERSLNEQTIKIKTYKILADKNNEFTDALVNSFVSSSLLQLPRSQFGAESLYYDNRSHQQRTQIELPSAVVSEGGEKLMLGNVQDSVINAVGVKLHSDNSSYDSTKRIDIENPITNIIDGKRGTFWYRNVYLQSTVEKVTTVLEFDLGRGYDINYIHIEGGTQEPFFIESIEGIAPDGHRISLEGTLQKVEGKSTLFFTKTFVQAIKVTFSVLTYHKANYFLSSDNNVHDAFNPDNKYNKLIRRNALLGLVGDALATKGLQELVNVPVIPNEQISSYRYTFALDNIWFGNDIYKGSGIFVSKPLKVSNVGTLAVRTSEGTQTGTIQDSIEYEIIKIDSVPKFKETKFSIPKMNQSTVESERLILTKRESSALSKDVGALRFCPYIPTDTIESGQPIYVYKDGEVLNIGTDYEISIAAASGTNLTFDWRSLFTDLASFDEYTLTPPKVWVKIKEPSPNSVYTVNYTIRTSDYNINNAGSNEGKTVWLDSDQTVSLDKGGRVCFREQDHDVTIDSEIYLQVTLRRNKSSQDTTPELYEYAVLAASYN